MRGFSLWFERQTAFKLFVIALILRLIWFGAVQWYGGSWMVHDSSQFLLLTDNILEFGEFSRSPEAPFFPDIARTPGYPVFLLLWKSLHFPLSIIAFIQLLLAAFIPALLYQTAREMNLSSPLLAGGLATMDFALILFAPYILSDGVFLFLLALFLRMFVSLSLHGDRTILTGLVLGVLILVRPIAQFLPVVVIIWWFWQRSDPKKLAVFLISALLLPGAWMIRNYAQFNTMTLSSMGTNNLLLYNAAGVLAEVNDQDLTTAQSLLARSAKNGQDWENDPLATAKYLRECKTTALDIIGEHPGIFLKQTARSAALLPFKPARSYVDMALDNNYSYAPVQGLHSSGSFIDKLERAWTSSSPLAACLSLYQLLFNFLVFVLAAASVWQKGLYDKWTSLLVLLLLYFWATSLVTQPDARFRLPMALALMLLASGLNFEWLRTTLSGRRRKH